jgi:hypothetical protein
LFLTLKAPESGEAAIAGMGPGEGEDSIPDGIGGEGISGPVNGLGLVDGVIGIIGGGLENSLKHDY